MTSFFSTPFLIVRALVSTIQFRLIPLPFTRREVFKVIAPVHGRAAARLYFAGLRIGYLRGPGMSGRFFLSLGMRDGSVVRRDFSQWAAILQSRASERIKLD